MDAPMDAPTSPTRARTLPARPARRWRRAVVAVVVSAVVAGLVWTYLDVAYPEQCFQHAALGFHDEPTYDPRELAGRDGTQIPDGASGPEPGLRDEPGTYRWRDGSTTWELTVRRGASTGTWWEFGMPRVCRNV